MNSTAFERARQFVFQHARPLDFARWCFYFEGGSAESVLSVLSRYQNNDGGFGHGLEADFWNPASSPMQTWAATEVLHGVKGIDAGHPLVAGILRYLASGADFDGRKWLRTVPSNNAHPHAPWWEHPDTASPVGNNNPTVSLAGFALLFSERGSALHNLASRIAKNVFVELLEVPSVEMHELGCFLRLSQCCEKAALRDLADLSSVEKKLEALVDQTITKDTDKWGREYICKPSAFIRSRSDRFYKANRDIVQFELEFLGKTQLEDGSWPVSWSWGSYADQWPVAREWWKSIIVIENMLFLKGMESSGD